MLFHATRMINGVGTGLITLMNFTEVGRIGGEKGKLAGFFSFGNGAGAIIGHTIGGLIGDAFGVQAIFLAFIVPFGALAFFTMMERRRNGELHRKILPVLFRIWNRYGDTC